MDEAAEVVVLGTVSNNPYLNTEKFKVILEFLKRR
jgi:hypothetical protein